MSGLRRLGTSIPGTFGFPLGAVLAVLVTIGLATDGATTHPVWAEIGLAATVAGLAALTTPAAVLGTAVLSWFLLEGFVVGRDGQITLTTGSLRAAAVLVLVAVAGVALATAIRVLTGVVAALARYRTSAEATASAHRATASST